MDIYLKTLECLLSEIRNNRLQVKKHKVVNFYLEDNFCKLYLSLCVLSAIVASFETVEENSRVHNIVECI